MKHTAKYLLTAILVILTLSGCSNEKNEPQNPQRKDCPEFTANIVDLRTRAYDSTWEIDDEIGISGSNRSNVCHITTEGDGIFQVKTAGEQIYFQNDGDTDFTAYYPWTSLTGGSTTIYTDTRNQAQQKQFDYLWAKASGKKDAPNVAFNFSHRMSRLVLTLRLGSDMSYEEMKRFQYSLSGFSHTGTFNINDGTTSAGSASEAWNFSQFAEFNDAELTASFSFILIPQILANPLEFVAQLKESENTILNLSAQIDFTSANREKDGPNARNEWVAGRQYNLRLTLNKTEISLDKCIINSWNVVDGEEIIVD